MGCGLLIVCVLVAGKRICHRRRIRDAARTPLLATSPARGSPSVNAPGSPSGDSTLAGLQGFTVVRTLRRDPHRMSEVLVVDRKARRPSSLTSAKQAAHLSVESPQARAAPPPTERVVVKRCVCETGRDRSRVLTEFMLLQRVYGKSRGRVVHPLDIVVTELVSKDGRLETLRDIARADIDAEGRSLDPGDDESPAPAEVQVTLSMKRLPNPFLVSIVMTYYPDGDLQAYLDAFAAADAVVPEQTCLAIAHQLAATVAVMHSKFRPPIVHGDLKPSNVVIQRIQPSVHSSRSSHARTGDPPHPSMDSGRYAPETHLLLADFGCARRATATATTGGAMTHKYAAPECFITGAPLTPAVDVFAIGVLLLQVALGKPPARALGIVLGESNDSGATVRTDDERPSSEVLRPSNARLSAALQDEIRRVRERGYSTRFLDCVLPLLRTDPAQRPNAVSLRELTSTLLGEADAFRAVRSPPEAAPSPMSRPSTPPRDDSITASVTSAGREMGTPAGR